MTTSIAPTPPRGRADLDMWLRRGCAFIVAAVAAYSSYEHQRGFALRGGADATSAFLWPLSVDGLLVLATVGLLKIGPQTRRRVRIVVWASFLLGIAMSLAANIAAAPSFAWQPVLVAGWPPVALLLAVELLADHPRNRDHADAELVTTEIATGAAETKPAVPVADRDTEIGGETSQLITLAEIPPASELTAQEIMWAHFEREYAHGRTPTGAELDRVAGTNNYGRTVVRQWREQGRIPTVDRNVQGGVA